MWSTVSGAMTLLLPAKMRTPMRSVGKRSIICSESDLAAVSLLLDTSSQSIDFEVSMATSMLRF